MKKVDVVDHAKSITSAVVCYSLILLSGFLVFKSEAVHTFCFILCIRSLTYSFTEVGEEIAIAVYVVSDGIDRCLVGFLPRYLIPHRATYENIGIKECVLVFF